MLKLPVGALFREGEDWAVFLLRNGRAELQRVTLGQRNDLEAEVANGVLDGARVIVHPSDKVENGVRIRAK